MPSPEAPARPSPTTRALRADTMAPWKSAAEPCRKASLGAERALQIEIYEWTELPALTTVCAPSTTAVPCSICGDDVRPAMNRLRAACVRRWQAVAGRTR